MNKQFIYKNELFNGFGADTSNFLWKEDCIYIMDNHRSAAWCWERCGLKEDISLFHIDAHYDGVAISDKEEELLLKENWQEMRYKKYIDLKYLVEGSYISVARWDNFIDLFRKISGKSISVFNFTHKLGDKPNEYKIDECRCHDIIENIVYLAKVERDNNRSIIFDIDIDYFVSQKNNIIMFSDKYMDLFFYGIYKKLIEKLIHFQLASIKEDSLHPHEPAQEWTTKSFQDQAMNVYRHPKDAPYTNRDLREVEKSLQPIANKGWVFFEDFICHLTIPVGDTIEVKLQKKGRRWQYRLPEYSENEYELMEKIIFDHLYEAGIIATGYVNDKRCFCLTPFGRMTLGH